jgi:hypothetical protein
MFSQFNNDDLVPVQVPRRYYEEVIRFLGQKMSEDTPSSTNPVKSTDSAVKSGDSKWWTKERIQRLKSEVKNPTALLLLNLTANRPNEWISFDKIHQEAKRSPTEARGDLRGLSMLIKRCFKVETAWWPVKVRDGSPFSYCMPEEIARRWKEAE